MDLEFGNNLIFTALILFLSVILSKSSTRFGLPILTIFLGIGMFIGPSEFTQIDQNLLSSFSLVALCLIIFSGGLMTKTKDVNPIFKSGVSLSTLGILVTTSLTAIFSYYVFELPVFESLLIGAILSSTDAAAVFTAFRDKNSQVEKKVKSLLEFESGSNDPMAYFLITLFLGLYQNEITLTNFFAVNVILNPLIGCLGGYLMFKTLNWINNSINLDFQGLYPALTLSFIFLTYGITSELGGNGFLAVYLFALKLGNAKMIHKTALLSFFDGVSWLSQISLFILLGVLVSPERLMAIAPMALGISLFLVFVGRPVSVFISTAFSSFNFKTKLLVSWGGLKGASPIVFASLVANRLGTDASLIFDIVFFTVLVSAIFQGMTLKPLAKKLNLLYEAVDDPEFPVNLEVLENTKNGIREYHFQYTDFAIDKRIVDLELPQGVKVLFIKRKGSFIIPLGSTVFEEHDRILIVSTDKTQIPSVLKIFQDGPEQEEPLAA